MPFERDSLLNAIRASGGKSTALDEADALYTKLQYLDGTGRYGQLLSNLSSANDKSNFLALALEATFAYQLEQSGVSLQYEVRQDDSGDSSIDFLAPTISGNRVFFELRLLQERASIAAKIAHQLQTSQIYRMVLNAIDEANEIIRLQSAILEKVQRADGTPHKFIAPCDGSLNVVVLDPT